MGIELKQRLIDPSRYDIKCPYTMSPKGITIHNTDNLATAQNEAAYMERRPEEVSFHIVVDDKEALQLIPFNRNAWHSSDGQGPGNRTTIALEIAKNFGDANEFAKAQENAAMVVAQICKQYGWTTANVYAHRDWSGKNCPSRTDMNKFKEKVKYYMDGTKPNIQPSPAPNTGIKVGDKVKATGAYYTTGQSIPAWVKANVYEVIQVNGNKVLLDQILSWVYSGEVVKVSNVTPAPTPAPSNKKYLNLKPHVSSWRIYPLNKQPVVGNECAYLAPVNYGGLSYEILEDRGDVKIIQTVMYGRVQIYAPRDNDSTITDKPLY